VNLYATLSQVRASLQLESTGYDALLLEALRRASRLLEAESGRVYYPEYAIWYLDGSGKSSLWLPETLLELTEIALSSDLGTTFTALGATDVWWSDGKNYDRPPYQLAILNPNGSYSQFYNTQRAVRITGWWGWHGDYGQAWETLSVAIPSGGITAQATTLTVTANALDVWGRKLLLEPGQILRIEDELVLVTDVDGTTGALTLLRGRGNTTAASHSAGTAIQLWHPDELAQQAVVTQASRWFKRGLQGYADAGGSMETGQVWVKKLDPDVLAILYEGGLRRLTVG